MNLVSELFGDLIISGLVHAHHFHVDRRGHTEVQDLGNDIRGLKEELRSRKPLRQHFAQFLDVALGRSSSLFVQLQKNFRVRSPDGARIAVSHVDAAIRQADVV